MDTIYFGGKHKKLEKLERLGGEILRLKKKYLYSDDCTCQNKILNSIPFDYARGPGLSFKSGVREGMRQCRIPSLTL